MYIRIPPETCGDIDKIIEILEDLRKANSQLRSAAEDYEKENERLENKIAELEDDIKELREENQ